MKILLVAVNAKYIHSNLAVYCLKSYVAAYGYSVEIAEYTINQQTGEVLRDLYEKKADVVAFSCYIWNVEFVKGVIKDYKKVHPQSEIWLGGPEVSYRAQALLQELPEVRGVMIGEGEETFRKIVSAYDACDINAILWSTMDGITVRKLNGDIVTTKPALPLDFSRLPFPYDEELTDFENRIIYYESSRGCPFSCAYCLSSIDKQVRFRDMALVKKELKFFLEKKVPQVKFIDRTFNVNNERTLELLHFIKENDNGITNFHFEAAAELLTEEQIELLGSLRPGLVQLEIGVQSTNEDTLKAVCRKTKLKELKEKVADIRKENNIHIHLDLIAGLPKEDLNSFKNSFNEVYGMRPHQLQLGFLKVLSGAPMEALAAENEIVYQSAPPYEVLSTKWLSYKNIITLKKVEEMVEVYYNSGQFIYSMMFLRHFFETPFELYEELAKYYERQLLVGMKLSRNRRYEILLEFMRETKDRQKEWLQVFEQILYFDYCLREKPKSRPGFGEYSRMDKQELKEAYISLGIRKEDEGMHALERFSFDPVSTAKAGTNTGKESLVLFSYEDRDAIYGQALTKKLEL